MNSQARRPRIVVIGGGFGGLKLVKALKRAKVDIVLIDKHNYHVFQPLLYQGALAILSPAEIAYTTRAIFSKQKNVEVLLAEVTAIDLKNKSVKFTNGETNYDYLVIASGAKTSYFGHPEWEQYTLGLKDIRDALKMRERVLLAFEAAERETDPEKQKQLLTFVIIGGGPTGIELAGMLAEMAKTTLSQDFRNIDPKSARIILLEGLGRVLSAMPEDCSVYAKHELEKKGVEVRTSTFVKDIKADGVVLEAEFIPSATIMWCAGVAATPLAKTLEGIELDRGGRITVEPDLSLKGYPEVFAIGDACVFLHQDGKPLPGLAPVAMQQGKAVAQSIRDDLADRARKKFHYVHQGSLAIIGRSAAVADFNGLHLKGVFAWLAWLFIHVLFLIGFRNRLVVMFDWMISYFTNNRGARLITGNKLQAGPDPHECNKENAS